MTAIENMGGLGGRGIIIHDRGKYSIYGFAGKIPDQESTMKECRTKNVSQPSVHVRFRN
jgi:hypothetical protein